MKKNTFYNEEKYILKVHLNFIAIFYPSQNIRLL